jgi:hypothetical protein
LLFLLLYSTKDKKIESVRVGKIIAFKRDTMMVEATMSFFLRYSIPKGLE